MYQIFSCKIVFDERTGLDILRILQKEERTFSKPGWFGSGLLSDLMWQGRPESQQKILWEEFVK